MLRVETAAGWWNGKARTAGRWSVRPAGYWIIRYLVNAGEVRIESRGRLNDCRCTRIFQAFDRFGAMNFALRRSAFVRLSMVRA